EAARRASQHPDAAAVGHQPTRHVGPHESGGARDQHIHGPATPPASLLPMGGWRELRCGRHLSPAAQRGSRVSSGAFQVTLNWLRSIAASARKAAETFLLKGGGTVGSGGGWAEDLTPRSPESR